MELSQAQGRYYILESGPMASPGCCSICGYSSSDRRYIDPRLDFDEYGSVIFCGECIAAMSLLMGYIEPAQAQALEARVEEAERQLIQLRATSLAMEDLRVALAGTSIRASLYGSGSSDSPDGSSSQMELPFEDNVVGEGSDDFTSDESVSVQGPDDVRNTAKSANDFDFDV